MGSSGDDLAEDADDDDPPAILLQAMREEEKREEAVSNHEGGKGDLHKTNEYYNNYYPTSTSCVAMINHNI